MERRKWALALTLALELRWSLALLCEASMSEGVHKPSRRFVRCPPGEDFCVKIRFQDEDSLKYISSCAHRQTCAMAGCALTRTPAINHVSVATCCCQSNYCNQHADVDSLLYSRPCQHSTPRNEPRKPRFVDEPISEIVYVPSSDASRVAFSRPFPLPVFVITFAIARQLY